MPTTDPRARALPLRRWPLRGGALLALPLLVGLAPAAGADPAPMSSPGVAICGCVDHDPACIDEAWPAGGPLLDQLDACDEDGEGACAAEALLDLAELDPPACLPEGYARLITPAEGGALPTGRAIGLVWWSWGRVPFDLSVCTEANKRNLSPMELQLCLRAGLIGDTEDGGRLGYGVPGDGEGWIGGGAPELGGG